MKLSYETKQAMQAVMVGTVIGLAITNAFAATMYFWLCVVGNACN